MTKNELGVIAIRSIQNTLIFNAPINSQRNIYLALNEAIAMNRHASSLLKKSKTC